ARDIAAVEHDRARSDRQEFREQVEAGGLSGAIRADQRMHVMAPDPKRHVVHGIEATKLLGQAARFKDVAVARGVHARPPSAYRASGRPRTPRPRTPTTAPAAA